MNSTADDNFFIEEPLRNNFFNKDIQMVELLRHKRYTKNTTTTRTQPIAKTFRYTYNKKLQEHTTTSTMPKSFISRLEILCQATCDTDDISVAKRAVDTLVSASKNGCCFLEKYIVILLNFCTENHPVADDNLKIEIEKLLDKVLSVDFDRQQLIENLRRPELKLSSVKNIIQLLRKVRDMLDYLERVAIDWLFVILDAYFVELATTDEAVDIVNQISAHINFQSALLRETNSTKIMLNLIFERFDHNDEQLRQQRKDNPDYISMNTMRHLRPDYSIEYIEI